MRSRLGPLALESKLGDHPSQSNVWRAMHVRAKRSVAAKIFSNSFGGTVESRRALASEWAAMQTLDHPAIAKCFGGGFESGDAYLVHEWIDGETLSSTLESKSRLPWETVLDLGDAILDAFCHLQERGFTHGQLVPDKILLSGLACVLVDVRTDRTGSPYSTGKPLGIVDASCMAPERLDSSGQIEPTSVATNAADLYAIGAVLYLSLTGRPATPDPPPASSLVMDLPVWLDKVLTQWLSLNPNDRGPAGQTAAAAKAALSEVRRRSVSRTSVAAATSRGFSPLDVNNQTERDQVRKLLGREPVSYQEETPRQTSSWYERPAILVAALAIILGGLVWMLMPLSEDQLRQRAEVMMQSPSRSDLVLVRRRFLNPLIDRFPDSPNASWAADQIGRIEMLQAENALSAKVKRNLPLEGEGERLYAEASRFEQFGDLATALDKYRSLATVLDGDPQYRPYVDLANRQIAAITGNLDDDQDGGEASVIILRLLDEADRDYQSGSVVAAKRTWLAIQELYENNDSVAPLVDIAQRRLSGDFGAVESESEPPERQ